MKQPCWLVLAAMAMPATSARAQSPSPAVPASAVPPREPGAGSAGGTPSEHSFEPEHVASTKPVGTAPSLAVPEEALTLDRLVLSTTNRIDLNFFGDVSLEQLEGQKPAFAVGPLGFQFTAHLTDGLVGRSEIVMSYQDGETILDVERAYLEYRTTRWAFAVGRTHAEFGYWNNAFHHGRWLQLTINRPHVLRFEDEGGILQVHSVGASISYAPQRGDSGLELAVGVANGHGRTIERIQTEGDNNWAKSVLVRIGAVGIGHPALRFGVNAAVDSIAPEAATVRPLLADKPILEIITGAYLALRGEHVMVFSETYNVLHRGGGKSWQVTDGFLIAGYRIGQFIPFGEIEARRGDGLADPYYSPDPAIDSESVAPGSFVEGTAGLRYELNAWSALKLELAAGSFERVSDYRAEVNWSFGR
jgi:hypothetical protein